MTTLYCHFLCWSLIKTLLQVAPVKYETLVASVDVKMAENMSRVGGKDEDTGANM